MHKYLFLDINMSIHEDEYDSGVPREDEIFAMVY